MMLTSEKKFDWFQSTCLSRGHNVQLQSKLCCSSADLCLGRKVAASLGHQQRLSSCRCSTARLLLHALSISYISRCILCANRHPQPTALLLPDGGPARGRLPHRQLVTFPPQIESTVYPGGAHRAVVEAKAPGDIEPRLRVKLCRID